MLLLIAKSLASRARIIMDQTGVKRLEATDDSVHLMGDRHVVSATPAWRAEMRMSGLHLPRVSMPLLSAFGRHSAKPTQPGQQPAVLPGEPELLNDTDPIDHKQKCVDQV